MSRKKGKIGFFERRWKALVVIVLPFVLYGNTVANLYSLDDEYVTYGNPKIQKGIQAIPEILTSYYADNLDVEFGYRPIAQLTFAIEYSLFGANPHMSHLINIFLYVLSALILMRILDVLLSEYNKLLPFLITILFVAHPIHTEVVASLKNREELLSFMFALLSLYYVFRHYHTKKILGLVGAVICFILAYLSKETSFMFALIIPLCLYFFTDSSFRKTALIFALFFVIAYGLRKAITINFPGTYKTSFFENPLAFYEGFLVKLSSYSNVLWFYIKKLVLPHPLGYYYGYSMIPLKEFVFTTFVSAGVHLFMLVLALKGLKKKKLYSFAIFYYLISIFLFSNMLVKINGIVGERLVYQASLGFIIVLLLIIFMLLRLPLQEKYLPFKKMKYLIIVVLLFLVPYSAKTISRNTDWYDHYTLYSHDIEYLKNSAKANSLIGNWLHQHLNEFKAVEKKKKIIDIEYYYKQSLSIDGGNALVANNLGTIYLLHLHSPDSAIKYFEHCLSIDSTYSLAHFNLAQCYELKDRSKESVDSYEKALKYDPNYLSKISQISIKYAENRFYDKAITLNEVLMDQNPKSAVPYYNLANIYVLKGDTATGLEYAEKSLEIDPNNHLLAQKTAEFYEIMGNKEKANFYFKMIGKTKFNN